MRSQTGKRNTALLLAGLLALASAPSTAVPISEEDYCEAGKGIERTLGRAGFRVVASGGYKSEQDNPVKVQIWQRDNRDWVVTEDFMSANRTCVVRSGVRLHMLY